MTQNDGNRDALPESAVTLPGTATDPTAEITTLRAMMLALENRIAVLEGELRARQQREHRMVDHWMMNL